MYVRYLIYWFLRRVSLSHTTLLHGNVGIGERRDTHHRIFLYYLLCYFDVQCCCGGNGDACLNAQAYMMQRPIPREVRLTTWGEPSRTSCGNGSDTHNNLHSVTACSRQGNEACLPVPCAIITASKSDYMLSFRTTHSLFALKSKAKRMAQLAADRKRRAVAYRLFAENKRLRQTEMQV